MIAHIDFETRSAVNLKDTGVDTYAKDMTTDAWCLAYAFGESPVHIWGNSELAPSISTSMECPLDLRKHVESGGLVYAHNAPFEWNIWNKLMVPRYGWPELKWRQMRCTMAMAYAMSIPGSLENAAAAVGLEVAKDMEGHRLMMQMAKPRNPKPGKPLKWWDDLDRQKRLREYCIQDVITERALHKRLRELNPTEQALWILDQEINERGVYVDLRSIEKAIDQVELAKMQLDGRIEKLTGGAVTACSQTLKLADWVNEQGVECISVAKADLSELLTQDLPKPVREALLIRQEAGKSSTAKLEAMLKRASEDQRVRGTMQYHAASTGRWGGRGIQVHNFPRPKLKQHEIEDAIAHLDDPFYLELTYGSVMDVMPSLLRGMISAAPGNELICADYSNIEGRVLAWLAGEEWKLEAFKAYDEGTGPDLYKLAYARSFGIDVGDVDSQQRQIGKVMELALGYQGGVGAFQTMARGYEVEVPDQKADELKVAWREAHPEIVKFWYAIENAALEAVATRDKVVECGPVAFVTKGSFLFLRLPSGRLLCYPYPRLETITTPWGAEKTAVTYMGVDAVSKKWIRQKTYGGKLVENITQAVARDILAEAIVRLDDNLYEIVMHVHDEIVAEMPIGSCELKDFERIMAVLPKWAKGLPVAVEGWKGERYRK